MCGQQYSGTAIRSRGTRVFGRISLPRAIKTQAPVSSADTGLQYTSYTQATYSSSKRPFQLPQFLPGSLASGLALTLMILECLASWLTWPHNHKTSSLRHSQGKHLLFLSHQWTDKYWEVRLANCATSTHRLLSLSDLPRDPSGITYSCQVHWLRVVSPFYV